MFCLLQAGAQFLTAANVEDAERSSSISNLAPQTLTISLDMFVAARVSRAANYKRTRWGYIVVRELRAWESRIPSP
jgi:hypothetical protein